MLMLMLMLVFRIVLIFIVCSNWGVFWYFDGKSIFVCDQISGNNEINHAIKWVSIVRRLAVRFTTIQCVRPSHSVSCASGFKLSSFDSTSSIVLRNGWVLLAFHLWHVNRCYHHKNIDAHVCECWQHGMNPVRVIGDYISEHFTIFDIICARYG